MEIISEPERLTITVRDLDVDFANGDRLPLTLYPADTLDIPDDGTIRITFVEKSQEELVIRGAQVRAYALRARTITVPVPKPETGGSRA
jgi:hypothetical protein